MADVSNDSNSISQITNKLNELSNSINNTNNSINQINSSLTGSINSVNSNLTNQVNSINSQLSNKLSNNAQVTIEIQPQAGRAFSYPNHKLTKRTYDGLLSTWMNPNDTTLLYNWKLTAV
jgi:ABC-type transporter Mla subunit MlaD